jgi:hypothetical protein
VGWARYKIAVKPCRVEIPLPVVPLALGRALDLLHLERVGNEQSLAVEQHALLWREVAGECVGDGLDVGAYGFLMHIECGRDLLVAAPRLEMQEDRDLPQREAWQGRQAAFPYLRR